MSEEINVQSIKKSVSGCCRSTDECESCQGKSCLIGFAKLVVDYAGAKKSLTIPNGIKMVPTGDYKVYDAEQVAAALATINRECKNCMDSHDDNCIINVTRSSLEVALLGEHVPFSGNPLAYIMSLSQINPEIGAKVMGYYRAVK